MATPKELRQALADVRADLHAALHHVHETWEQKPPAGEGEESWSPKEVAQHVIGADWFFTNMIVQACGYPALERPHIDVSTPAQAAASLARIAANDDNYLRHVTDEDLRRTAETRFGPRSVEELMAMLTRHAREHTEQLLALGA